ncbi:hypothetical protein ACFVFF_07465 [Streptomyces sp. NPDC057680]|uniref:hypothetical protein n=1 Tax=Streptomyces sp. NPDC057680 TaxID=3346208 RepID=UPI0036A69496
MGRPAPATRLVDRLPPLYGPDPQTGEFTVWDQAAGGRSSTPPAFQGAGGGLVSSAYADPANQLTGILLTQVGLSTPDTPRTMNDFWTTLYQAIN